MASTALHLLVILLGFSHLLFLNAVPITRTRDIMHETQGVLALDDTHQAITDETLEEELFHGRMDFESKDYPGSGANNRHTPPKAASFGRG